MTTQAHASPCTPPYFGITIHLHQTVATVSMRLGSIQSDRNEPRAGLTSMTRTFCKSFKLLADFACLIYRITGLTNVRDADERSLRRSYRTSDRWRMDRRRGRGARLRLLQSDWPGDRGPSYERALASCRACVSADLSGVGAMATFAVAAMEAGLPFERHDDYLAFTEARVASVAQLDLREARTELFS